MVDSTMNDKKEQVSFGKYLLEKHIFAIVLIGIIVLVFAGTFFLNVFLFYVVENYPMFIIPVILIILALVILLLLLVEHSDYKEKFQ